MDITIERKSTTCGNAAACYLVPSALSEQEHCAEIYVRRSRFLASCVRASNPVSARSFVDRQRGRYSDATHNCWAYVAGPPGNTAYIGASDDGEPHGTAGKPMLNVLLHSNIGEICVVVSRWFGGIKLGTGGLVRAYQDAVRENLSGLALVECIVPARCVVGLAYTHLDGFYRLLPRFGAKIIARQHLEAADIQVELSEAQCPAFAEALAELTNGAYVFKILQDSSDLV